MNYPKKVIVTEVGPRDGLQNESGEVPTAAKIELIESLVQAGVQRIEATSFVSPKWVPQMADAAEVMQGITRQPGVRYIVLTPNLKGMERALENGAQEIAVFTAASESFTKKNINTTIVESIENFRDVIALAKKNNIWVRGYVSTCFVCPYEGQIEPAAVYSVAKRLVDAGVDEISIGDTVGAATPNQVDAVVVSLLAAMPAELIALHFHDTRGTALANVLRGLQLGITKYDSSAGGLGGCPYAPGAAGNLATEDLLYLLHGLGIETGIELAAVVQASQKIAKILGRTLNSKYLQSVSH